MMTMLWMLTMAFVGCGGDGGVTIAFLYNKLTAHRLEMRRDVKIPPHAIIVRGSVNGGEAVAVTRNDDVCSSRLASLFHSNILTCTHAHIGCI